MIKLRAMGSYSVSRMVADFQATTCNFKRVVCGHERHLTEHHEPKTGFFDLSNNILRYFGTHNAFTSTFLTLLFIYAP